MPCSPSLSVQRVGHLLRSMDVEGPALEALMPLQRRIEQVLLQHLLPSGFDASAPTTLPELARAVAALPVRSGVGAGLQDMRRVAPCAAWAAQNESCELQAELRRKPVGGDDVAEARERVLMRLPELLRKQAGGLKHACGGGGGARAKAVRQGRGGGLVTGKAGTRGREVSADARGRVG